MIEQLDAATLEIAVQESEQAGIFGKLLLCILAVALGNALCELACNFYYCIVVFNITSHFTLKLKLNDV